MNPVLERLRAQRAEQMAAMDAILDQVDDRDLVDAERSLLEASRQRIDAIDAQITPLEEYENRRDQHVATVTSLPRPERLPAEPRRADGGGRDFAYATAGEFMVDLIRARGLMERSGGSPDPAAQARVAAAYQQRADVITSGLTGVLPSPIVGAVVNIIDANRPLVTSLGGARPLGGIPGVNFTRPKISTHVQSGAQTAEKASLPSRAMVITPVSFTKSTRGGFVDVSRQSMDWSSPAAWDIIVRDLADQYAIDTETVFATAFAAAATGVKPVMPASPVLADWTKALYTAGMHSYQGGQRMPDRIWMSLDVWAGLGQLVDTTRVVLPVDTTREMGAPGTSSLAEFAGDLFGLPRIVAPLFPAKTLIVGNSQLYEVYEEVIGLLSVVEPSILGVQVAYGGYIAYGTLAGPAFCAVDLTATTTLPTMLEAEEMAEAEGVSTEGEEIPPEEAQGPGTPRRRR